MANWCSNYIDFYGEKENLENLLKRITETTNNNSVGALIHSGTCIDGYFFDVDICDIAVDSIAIRYESRWSHNFGDLAAVCKEFSVTAEAEFSEPGCDYYGHCQYAADGTYVEDFICELFLDEIEFDYSEDIYKYRGDEWDYKDDIITDMYHNWVKEYLLLPNADTRSVMQIANKYISAAVIAKHKDENTAAGIIKLLTSIDPQNVTLGLVLHTQINTL